MTDPRPLADLVARLQAAEYDYAISSGDARNLCGEAAAALEECARERDELQARMAVMDRLYAVARDVAIDMGDWPIDVTFGESGRDWIKRLDGARTDVELYDAQSPARARERAYLSTIAPSPDPTTWEGAMTDPESSPRPVQQ